VAYALDPATGTWLRWFRYAAGAEPEISSAADIKPPDINTLDKLQPGQQLMALGALKKYTAQDFLGADPLEDSEYGHIVFATDRDGDWDIYRMYGDGAKQQELTFTDNAEDEIQPAWSPDGLYIAFASNRDRDGDTDPEDDFDIYVMDNRGGTVKPLFGPGTGQKMGGDQFNPFWWPDGDKICYEDLWGCGLSSPCWSIDCVPWPPPQGWAWNSGETYACEADWHITLKSGDLRCHGTNARNGDWAAPFYPKQGKSGIAFTYECDADGGQVDQLCGFQLRHWGKSAFDEDWWHFDRDALGMPSRIDPAFAPGSLILALASNDPRQDWTESVLDYNPADFNLDIWLYRGSWMSSMSYAISHKTLGIGTEWKEYTLRITNDPADDRQPTWSPGEVYIAFVSDRTGTDQIYRIYNGGTTWKGPWGYETQLTFAGRNRDPDWWEGIYRSAWSCQGAP